MLVARRRGPVDTELGVTYGKLVLFLAYYLLCDLEGVT